MSILDAVLAPLQAKAKLIGFVVGGIAIVGVIVTVAYYWSDYKTSKQELKTAEATVARKTEEVKEQGQTIETQKQSAAITEQVETKVTTTQRSDQDKVNTISQAHKDAVVKIEEKFKTLPATPENAASKAAEISKDRINRLWEVFCLGNPENKNCQPKAAQ